MRQLIIHFLIVFLLLIQVNAAESVLDLRQAHSMQEMINSNLAWTEYSSGEQRRSFDLAPQKIKLLLPGGRSLNSVMGSGSFTTDKSGNLVTLSFSGPILPDEEAYKLALYIHQSFGIATGRLDGWWQNIQGKGRDAPTYMNGLHTHYPDLNVEICSSMNSLYPWFIRIVLSWNLSKGDLRNENWAQVNNPRPAKGFEVVTIDSPTGKLYDLKEAYKHLIKDPEQIKKAEVEIEKRFGISRDENGRIVRKPVPKVNSGGFDFVLTLVVLLLCSFVGVLLWKTKVVRQQK